MAPALGLYLNNVFFDGYNIKQHHLEGQDERATLRKEYQGDRGKDGDDDATHERKEAAEDDNAQQADDGDDKDEQVGVLAYSLSILCRAQSDLLRCLYLKCRAD